MTEIEKLLAIEEIKRLKSTYFYYLDYETCVHSAIGWRIKSTRLTRLYVERT